MKSIMQNKRGEFLARDYVIFSILFGVVCLMCYLMVADIASPDNGYNNPNMTDSEFSGRYDTLTDSLDSVSQMHAATTSGEGLSTISTYTLMFKSTFSVISLTFGGFALINSTFAHFAEDFGIPSSLANLFFPAILAILIVLLVFIIISSVSQSRI